MSVFFARFWTGFGCMIAPDLLMTTLFASLKIFLRLDQEISIGYEAICCSPHRPCCPSSRNRIGAAFFLVSRVHPMPSHLHPDRATNLEDGRLLFFPSLTGNVRSGARLELTHFLPPTCKFNRYLWGSLSSFPNDATP